MINDPVSAPAISPSCRPVRRLISRGVQWVVTHCPRPVRNHFDLHRSFYAGLLPKRIKQYLKTTARLAGFDVSLHRRLDHFLTRQAADNSSGRVFLIFSGVTFTESEGQRPTRFARELAGRGIPVIFAYWRWKASTPAEQSGNPGVFCLPIDEFRKDYENLLADQRLSSLKRVFMMEFPHPCLFEIVNYANVSGWRTVYDVIDDWEEFHKRGQAVWYDRDLETYLLQNADVATITQNNLLKKMSDLGAERFVLLPNACEDWGEPGKNSLPPMRKGRITIGYFGHLTSSWFDWPLVVALAKRRPDWTFHIIGYGLDKRIESLDNLIFLGRVEHGDLPALAKNWDAAMIPFQASKLSAAVDPIKIYEYISLRLPTVVSGMPHLASYPGVFTASNAAEFEAALEKAAKTKIDAMTAETFLSANRWSNRIDALLKILDEGEYWNATSLALTKDELTAGQAAA
ncbi:MAG: glycosyltransferase [Thermoguttaceae bacterium]|jgi:glycosyltransferase involved in cell wall biosynthesis